MIEALLLVLAAVSVACALVLAMGGTRGIEASNPWWVFPAIASILLTLHAFGYLFADATWVVWAAVVLAVGGMIAFAVRELSFWSSGVMSRPTNRESLLQTALGLVAILGAQALYVSFPGLNRVALIAMTLIPLLGIRWALTRLKRQPEKG